MTALVVAEHDNASVKGATLNTVSAAALCGGDAHVLIAGHNAGGAAKQAAQIAGVTKVIHAEGEHFAHGLAENIAAHALAVAGAYSHILFPATASGKNIAPRVAAKLDVGQISDVTKVDSPDTFERPIYAGNAIATVQSLDEKKVITVRTTGFDPAAATGGSGAVESARATPDSGKSRFEGNEIAKNDRPELTAAMLDQACRPVDQFLHDRLDAAPFGGMAHRRVRSMRTRIGALGPVALRRCAIATVWRRLSWVPRAECCVLGRRANSSSCEGCRCWPPRLRTGTVASTRSNTGASRRRWRPPATARRQA